MKTLKNYSGAIAILAIVLVPTLLNLVGICSIPWPYILIPAISGIVVIAVLLIITILITIIEAINKDLYE